MDVSDAHPILAVPILLASIAVPVIVALEVLVDFGADVSRLRARRALLRIPALHTKDEALEVAAKLEKKLKAINDWDAIHEAVFRYLVIPYLVCLPLAIVNWLAFEGGGYGVFKAVMYSFIGWIYWKRYKDRNRKHKIKEKVLAKIEQLEGKLVVVPVSAK